MCSVSASAPRELNCETCGKGLTRSKRGRQPRYCPKGCRPEYPRNRSMRFVCAKCGGPSSRPTGIGTCRRCYVPHNAGTTIYPKIPCDHCAKPIAQKNSKGYASRFCGVACRQEHDRKRMRFICRRCGVTVTRPFAGKDSRKFCSPTCSAWARADDSRPQRATASFADWAYSWDAQRKRSECDKARLEKHLARTCRKCGISIGHLPATTKNCLECQRTHDVPMVKRKCKRCGRSYETRKFKPAAKCQACTKQIMKRRAKHSSRCRRRGLPYDPKVTPAALYAMHKGKCFWCGVECVSKYTHGKQRDKSPTIDHIVPINHESNTTHGHTMSNCVLSCAQCNSMKSDSLDDGALRSASPVDYMSERVADGRQWKQKDAFMDSWINQPKTPLFEHFARQQHKANRATTQQNNAFSP